MFILLYSALVNGSFEPGANPIVGAERCDPVEMILIEKSGIRTRNSEY
jgi:hypothetical protein